MKNSAVRMGISKKVTGQKGGYRNKREGKERWWTQKCYEYDHILAHCMPVGIKNAPPPLGFNVPFIVWARASLLSSHDLSAFRSCRILSLFPCRMSLMLTLPIFTSLSSKKSKRRKRPSSLSSVGPTGKAESGTGGEDGLPLIDSARRRSARPPKKETLGSSTCREAERWELAHSTKLLSAGLSCFNKRVSTIMYMTADNTHRRAYRIGSTHLPRRSRGSRLWGLWDSFIVF
jgi:hypothetical protein